MRTAETLTVTETARLFRVATPTVYGWINRGVVTKHIRYGRIVLLKREVDQWQKTQTRRTKTKQTKTSKRW